MKSLPDKWKCSECGAIFTKAQLEGEERFWVPNPLGLYYRGADAYGRSYDKICPACGAENPFRPFYPDNDPHVDDVQASTERAAT